MVQGVVLALPVLVLFDHGMPRENGTVSKEQRPEADINIEFQANSKLAAQSQAMAWVLEQTNEKYPTDYPASVGSHMTNTDSSSFMDVEGQKWRGQRTKQFNGTLPGSTLFGSSRQPLPGGKVRGTLPCAPTH